MEAWGSVVGSCTMLLVQAGRFPVRVLDEVDFFNLPNRSSHTMGLELTQPLTKMSTRNLPGGKKHQRIGLTTLPPSVSIISENVGASTSCNPKGPHCLYRGNFTFTMPAHDTGDYVSALSWTVPYHLSNVFLYVHIWQYFALEMHRNFWK
jgi:hypothetical protein